MAENEPIYTTHNFSAIDAHVNEVIRRERAFTRIWMSEGFLRFAKYGALLIVALGIAIFLTLWGYSLLTEKPEARIIEKEVVVERPVAYRPVINITPGAIADQLAITDARDAAASKIEKLQEPDPLNSSDANIANQGKKTVFDFVIFKTITFARKNIDEVKIGMRYADSASEKPSRQWCYIDKQIEGFVARRIDLAHKQDDEIFITPVSDDDARTFGARISNIRQAQRLCKFL
jgi:hypothetical protein